MTKTSIFTREKYIFTTKIAITIVVFDAFIQLFHIGGDNFVISFSDTITVPLSLLTTLTVFLLWRRYLPFSAGRPLWIWFLIGWGAWGLGETWYIVQYWITGDVPYPGLTDIYFSVGYIGLIVGMVLRLHEANRHMLPRQRLYLLVIFLILTALTFEFGIRPELQFPSEQRLASILELFYPFCDLVLILLGVRLLFDYNAFQSRTGWRLIIIGFILMYISDLMSAYTSSLGLLYPDGHVNLISTLGYSIPYDLAYAFWMMGLYGLQVRLTAQLKGEATVQPLPVENTHILFYLNPGMAVEEISSNYSRVFNQTPMLGEDLAKFMPIKTSEMVRLKNDLTRHGRFADISLEVVDRKGKNSPAKLSGISILDSQKNLSGALAVLRIVSEVNNLDLELNDYQQSLVDQVRVKSGSVETQNIRDFLHAFFLPFFKRGFEMMLENAGYQQGVNFEEFLNRASEKNNWKVRFDSGSLIIDENSTPVELIDQFPAIFASARTQLNKISDPESVDIEVRKIRSEFSEEVLNNYYYIQHTWINRGK